MTTAAESHDAQLAAIKAEHQAITDKLNAPFVHIGTHVSLGSAGLHQVGLLNVWADMRGRLWTEGEERGTVRLIIDPNKGIWAGSPDDDTQAAQGFKAHEI